jgi:hypothetical protein
MAMGRPRLWVVASILSVVALTLAALRGSEILVKDTAPSSAGSDLEDGPMEPAIGLTSIPHVRQPSVASGMEDRAMDPTASTAASEGQLAVLQLSWTAPGSGPIDLVCQHEATPLELIPLGNERNGVRLIELPVGSWQFMLRGPDCASRARTVQLWREEVAKLQLDANATQSIRVQVLSAVDGLPVVGAELKLLDDLLAQPVTSDSTGTAILPGLTRPSEGGEVFAIRLVQIRAQGFAEERSFLMCSPSEAWWSLAVHELPEGIEDSHNGSPLALTLALQERGPRSKQGFPTIHGSAEFTRLYIWPSRTISGLLPWLAKANQNASGPATRVRCRGMVPTGLVTLDQVELVPEVDESGGVRLKGLHPLGSYCLELRTGGRVMSPLCFPPGFGDIEVGIPEVGRPARVQGRLDLGDWKEPVLRGRPCSCGTFKLAFDDLPLAIDQNGDFDVDDLTPCDYQIVVRGVDSYGYFAESVLMDLKLEPGQIRDLGLLTAPR